MELGRFYPLDVVLVCGLQASGKTHFSMSHLNRDGRKRVNRKEIRRMLYEMTSFGGTWREERFNEKEEFLVAHVERKIYEHLLQSGSPVLIDSTNVTADSRESYVTFARSMRKTIGCIFLNPPLVKCLERNRAREDRLSEGIITNLYASLELPTKAEGFRELLILEDY